MRTWNSPNANDFGDIEAKIELGLLKWWEAEFIESKYLIPLSNKSEVAKNEILRRIKKDGSKDLPVSNITEPHPDIQRAISELKDWFDYRSLLSDKLKEECFKRDDATLANKLEISNRLGANSWVLEELEHLPAGSKVVEKVFKNFCSCRSSYGKAKIQKLACKLPVATLEKEWPNLSNATRGQLLDRDDLPDKMRKTCLRIAFRSPMFDYKLTTGLPWDFLREVPLQNLHFLPRFVSNNMDKLTGKPITLDEYKKIIFLKILKNDTDFEEAVLAYDKLHVADSATQSLEDFFAEVKKIPDSETRKWMEACGTDTARNIAFTLLTRNITQCSSNEQAEMKKALDAEPKKISDYFKKEE